MRNNERLDALNILTELFENKTSLSHLMPSTAELSPLTKEICFGFCRHYYRLEAVANSLIAKRPKSIEVWIALLIGLYQLHYLNMPDYAVVKETVALLEKKKKGWAKGLVNAVLRNFCRKKNEIVTKLSDDPAFIHGQPLWFLERLKEDWPQDWQEISAANDTRPPMTLRVNLRKNTVIDYLKILNEIGIEAFKHPVAPEGITLISPCDVHELPGFAEGCVSVQDAAAQLAGSLLSLKPGLSLLDACCAPGGKVCHALELEPNLTACVALDVDLRRLKKVKENLSRLNLKATVIQGDALTPASWWDGHPFDRILLDAPCSATGVIRRHSDIKLLRSNEEIQAITQIQSSMLHSLWPLLAPGGLMVYATCSVLMAENEQQIDAFVSTHFDCQILTPQQAWGHATAHGVQILPGQEGMDGFFYSVLEKKTS
jgi:16S rRNA (cytosine967-C5)-methyltransferase